MGLIDGTITWIAQHTVALLVIMFIVAIVGFVVFISEPGQNLIKFLGANPIFIFAFPLMAASWIILYILLMRPSGPDDNRLNAKDTWKRAKREGWLQQYDLNRVRGIETAKHPTRGKFFMHVWRKDAGLQTVLLDDFKKTDEPVIWEFGEDLTRTELEKYMKKSIGLEEKIRMWSQADKERDILKKSVERDEESKEIFGNGTGAKI